MNCRPIKQADLASINRWRHRHSQPAVDASENLDIGFIVPGVACGFLRQCEGRVGILEGICTNSLVSPAMRNKALDAIMARLTSTPGFNRFIGYTVDSSTLQRAQRHGFRPTNYLLLVKE